MSLVLKFVVRYPLAIKLGVTLHAEKYFGRKKISTRSVVALIN